MNDKPDTDKPMSEEDKKFANTFLKALFGKPASGGSTVLPGFDAEVIAALGAEAERFMVGRISNDDDLLPGVPETLPYIIDRKTGSFLKIADYAEAFRIHPKRKRGTIIAGSVAGLISIGQHQKTDATVLMWCRRLESPGLRLVFNWHDKAGDEGEKPGFGDFVADYPLTYSPEWNSFKDIINSTISTSAFAHFIDQRISSIASPLPSEIANVQRLYGESTTIANPNTLMKVSRGLSINVESKVKGTIRTQSGEVTLQFEEQHTDTKTRDGESVTVPAFFVFDDVIFEGGQRTRIIFHLRYRVSNGQVHWVISPIDLDRVIGDAVYQIVASVQSSLNCPDFEVAKMPAIGG